VGGGLKAPGRTVPAEEVPNPYCPACGALLQEEPSIRGVDRLHHFRGEFAVAVCRACGSGRTLPPVPNEELYALYPAEYNPYALPATPLVRALATALFQTRYRRALRSGGPFAVLRTIASGRLLDVGSGRGDLGVALRDYGWDVTGLDPSPAACEQARARGVKAVEGTLLDGASLGGEYDAVVFNHSLEHVAEPFDDLVAARPLLRAGGVLVVSLPNFASWQRRRFQSAWFHLDLPRHRSHFTPRGLESLLERTGYDRIQTMTTTSADGLPMSVQYRLLGRRRFEKGLPLYGYMGATLLTVPVTATLDRLSGRRDLLHAIAAKDEPSR
jgi:SAM-dependent methyltransferase